MSPSPLPRLLVAAATCTALAGTLLACGTEGSSGDTGGEDSLVLYSGRNEDLVQPLIDDFSEASGIEVEVRYGDTAEMAAQLLEEGDRSPAQAFLGQDAGALGAVAEDGLLSELPEATVASVPERYRDQGGRWVGVTGRARVLVYNADNVSADELPDSVFDLTGPEWKGRVGVAPTNASFQSFITAMRELEGDDAAKKYLEDLANNEPAIRDGNSAIVADVNDGKIPLGLVNHYYLYQLAKEKGVEAEELKAANYLFPDGNIGALVNISGAGLVKHAADDDAARLLEYFLSTEGQTYFAEETHEYPMLEDVAGPAGLPGLAELQVPDVDLNDLDDLETTIQMITEAGLA